MIRRKIVAINCNLRSGGGKVMSGIAEVAQKYGFEYHTYSPEDRKDKPENHTFIISRAINYINLKLSKLIGYDNAIINYGTIKLIKQLKTKKPDIIHLHGLHGGYVDYKLLFKTIDKLDIPVIWTQHDCWAFTGGCTHFTYVNCNKWKSHCYNCPQLDRYPESLLFDNSKWMFSYKRKIFTNLKECRIVTVSKWLENTVNESYLATYPVQTIENGVDTCTFKYTDSNLRDKYNINKKIVILGVAASWNDRKGLKDFLKLRELLAKDLFEIVLIGLNEKQCEYVRELGVIGFKRTASKKELAEWYSVTDVFFNPSIEETFGLVTAEAMACGAPVIVYNTTASPELVKDTKNYIVEPNNLGKVIDCINDIKDIGRHYYEADNIQRVKLQYNQEKQYEKYIKLYNDVLNKTES